MEFGNDDQNQKGTPVSQPINNPAIPAPSTTPTPTPPTQTGTIQSTPETDTNWPVVKKNTAPNPELVPKKPVLSPQPSPAATPPPQKVTPPEEPAKNNFPFKPIEHESTPKADPRIDVSFEKTKDTSASIEVPDYENNESAKHPTDPITKVNNYQANAKDNRNNDRGGSVLTYGFVAVLCIGLGLVGGFFGYKYSPELTKLFSINADVNTSQTNVNSSADISQPKSTNALMGEISSWPSYTSTKYIFTIKYPDTWYGKNTNNANASNVVFSSINPQDITNTTGYKVEIVMQESNSKKLEDWIIAKNTTLASTTSKLTPLKVAGIDAFQQVDAGKSVATYLMDNNQVMTITYTGSLANFSTGQVIYNKILDSIKI